MLLVAMVAADAQIACAKAQLMRSKPPVMPFSLQIVVVRQSDPPRHATADGGMLNWNTLPVVPDEKMSEVKSRILAILSAVVCVFVSPAGAQTRYLIGSVTMEDGSAPPKRVLIERLCSGRAVQAGVTDLKGRFVARHEMRETFGAGAVVTAFSRTLFINGLSVCVLRASLPGYESSTIDLSKLSAASDPRLPPMILRPRPPGTDFNLEISRVPRTARKAWGRAVAAGRKQDWPRAELELRAAAQAAPQFADAWNLLGAVCQNGNKTDEAREAFRRALEANPKLLNTYLLLGRLDLQAGDWQAALRTSNALIQADAEHSFPEAHLHRAMACYNLRDLDGAKASALETIRLDRKREFPRAEFLLGVIMAAQRNFGEAREHLNLYLELDPKATDAAAVRERIENLGRQEPEETLPALNLVDARLSPAGEVWIPGGMKALAAIANVEKYGGYANFFSDYCRALIRNTTRYRSRGVPAYEPRLRAYFASIEELARAGERRGDRTVITLSLAGVEQRKETERILSLLGWKIVTEEGSTRIEIGDHPEDGLRQPIPAALGIDEISLEEALEAGRSFTIEVPSESVRLAGGDAWSTLTQSGPALPGGLAEAFALERRLAKAYVGLSGIDNDAAAAVVDAVGLRAAVEVHAERLSLYAEAFSISNGVAVTPGGSGTESLWAKLAGASPRDPPAFFRALLQKDRGALAAFYWVLWRADAARQKFFLASPSRAVHFYEWYRESGALQVARDEPASTWQTLFIRELPVDESGRVRFPGDKRAWGAADSPDENVLLGLAAPQVLAGVAQLERARGAPLDERSASLLVQHYEEWRALLPYFRRLPMLGRAEFESLAAFTESVRNVDTERRNSMLGAWYSLVELIALGHTAGALDTEQSAGAFRCVCTSLQARDLSAQALACLRTITGESGGLDEAVPSRLLRLDDARRSDFNRVLRSQDVPRLTSLASLAGDTQTVVAISGLVYAAWLDPDSLLISEDPLVLRKHRFADPGKDSGSLFLPAALERSSSISGSYLTGGFAGLDEVARELPRVDSADEPAATAPHSAPKVAAKAALADRPPMPTESVFRASGRLVEVYATVTDGRGRYVDNLPQAEFGLLEEGTPQRITAFESNSSAVSCALLLDSTASMYAALPALKNAALKLLDDLRETDSVAVYRFDRTVTLLQPFTTDKQAAKRAVLRAFPRDETALYDALTQVAREISGRGGKKVIVVFTDGEDNRSMVQAEAAIRRAKVIGAPVYTVAQGRALEYDELLKQLRNVSKATGGVPFAIREPREIRAVLERVGQDLAHGYLLAFPPPPAPDNNWRQIDVRLQHPRGYKVRAREGYYPE